MTLSEKEGLSLTLEKDIKRLKANLKLSKNENDQCQKRLQNSITESNQLKSVQLDGQQQSKYLQKQLEDSDR